jgi:hypothetical protein
MMYEKEEIDPEIQAQMPKASKTFFQMNLLEWIWFEIKRFFNIG